METLIETLRVTCVMLVLATTSAVATANVGFFSGAGHTVMLQKTADIQLVAEDVRIVAGFPRADYFCRFELKNLSSKPVSVQVGFPLTNYYEPFRQAPRGGPFADDQTPTPLDEAGVVADEYRFIARDKDRTYHVRYISQDAEARFRHILLWDMEFAPGETRQLAVSYTLGVSMTIFSADKRVWDHAFSKGPDAGDVLTGEDWFAAMARMASLTYYEYVTETGASWAGPIERATFRVDAADLEREIRRGNFLWSCSRNDPAVGADAVLPSRSVMWRGVTPEGWAIASDNGRPRVLPYEPPSVGPPTSPSIEWHFAPFVPGPLIVVSYVSTLLPADAESMGAFTRALKYVAPPGEPTAADFAALRETLVATCGVVPKSKQVRDVVEHLVWYSPIANRTEADFDAHQSALLAAYDAAVAEELARAEPTGAASAK